MTATHRLLVFVLLAVLILGSAWWLWGRGAGGLEGYAHAVEKACENAEYPPSCYDEEIPKLIDRGLSMEDAFAVTALIQSEVTNYPYCHVLAHKLAEKETAKDPVQWASVVERCPTSMCANGCIHGAIQQRFNADLLSDPQIEALVPELSTVCNKASLTQAQMTECYHALGHFSMYATGADVDRSLAMCERIAAYDGTDDDPFGLFEKESCEHGLFMAVFQHLEPEDIALVQDIAPKTQAEAESFCARVEGDASLVCHVESWPLYLSDIETPAGADAFCADAPDGLRKRLCYHAVAYVITPSAHFNARTVANFCHELSPAGKSECYAAAAGRFVRTDGMYVAGAAAICASASLDGAGEACYRALLYESSAVYTPDSSSFHALCEALPAPWKARCESGEGKIMAPDVLDDFMNSDSPLPDFAR